jgi:exoribonuclease II
MIATAPKTRPSKCRCNQDRPNFVRSRPIYRAFHSGEAKNSIKAKLIELATNRNKSEIREQLIVLVREGRLTEDHVADHLAAALIKDDEKQTRELIDLYEPTGVEGGGVAVRWQILKVASWPLTAK